MCLVASDITVMQGMHAIVKILNYVCTHKSQKQEIIKYSSEFDRFVCSQTVLQSNCSQTVNGPSESVGFSILKPVDYQGTRTPQQ